VAPAVEKVGILLVDPIDVGDSGARFGAVVTRSG